MLRAALFATTLLAAASAHAQTADNLGTPRSFTAPPAQQFQGSSGVQYTFQKAGFEGGYDARADVHRNNFQAQPLTAYGNPAAAPQAPAYPAAEPQGYGYYAPPATPQVENGPIGGPIGLTSTKQRWHPQSPYGPADVSAQQGYQPPVITSSYVSANSLYDPQTGETLIQIDPNILFEFSKWDIRQSTASDVVMGQIADAIRQAGRLTTLSAHTDFVDEQHFNFNLAQKRAISIRNWLISRGGIQPNMLEIEAHGEMYPIASNASAAGRAQNRRVTITIHGNSDARVYQRQFTGNPVRTMGYRAN